MSFEILGLSDELLKAVQDSGYTEPTAIQRQAIPTILQGRDVLAVAQTGTGKTASFTLPMIDILAQGRSKARMPRSLILEPTRELAVQVAENFERYGKYHKLSMALLIGGLAFGDQDRALDKGVDVLICTPGRLLDQFDRSKLMLSGVEILVIDEADRMLDMGFIPDVERICSLMPTRRQTLFFSATMPPAVKRLADQFLKEPKQIEVSRPASANASITQSIIQMAEKDKKDALAMLLKASDVSTAIIFCNKKKDVRAVHDTLKRQDFSVGQLHGDMEQPERLSVLERFRKSELAILVASDVAARGLDIPGVSHVFNFDVPFNAEDYVHRIGRTGRAGRSGISITLATPAEVESVAAVEALIQTKIPLQSLPGFGQCKEEEGASRSRGRRKTSHSTSRRKNSDSIDIQSAADNPSRDEDRASHKSPFSRKDSQRPEHSRYKRSEFYEDDGEPVLGLGHHVPAFFLVSARSALNTSGTDTA